MTYEELEIKIKSMSAKEIILAMVDSLQNPVTEINMDSFGHLEGEICYGCAATNTICKLGGLDPVIEFQKAGPLSVNRLYTENRFIDRFEPAIDYLRQGDIYWYNVCAREYGFSEIAINNQYLEEITNFNYQAKEVLQGYIDLANSQPR